MTIDYSSDFRGDASAQGETYFSPFSPFASVSEAASPPRMLLKYIRAVPEVAVAKTRLMGQGQENRLGRTQEADEVSKRFTALADAWLAETMHLSSIQDAITNENYLRIIAMGASVVPHILRRMQTRPDHWFVALKVVTGKEPVRPENRGDILAMTRDWLNWGARSGLIQLGTGKI